MNQRAAEALRARRAALHAEGLCGQCGDYADGFRSCWDCRRKMRQAQRERRRRLRAEGLCAWCARAACDCLARAEERRRERRRARR